MYPQYLLDISPILAKYIPNTCYIDISPILADLIGKVKAAVPSLSDKSSNAKPFDLAPPFDTFHP